MTTLLINGTVVNVFTGELERANVLIEDRVIAGVGDYTEADVVIDVSGKYICPSFIDSHIHIESTMLLPRELAKVCIRHGTGAIVADPHEIANVCGVAGIAYMMEAAEGLPMDFLFMLPSCVPATPFDENGAILRARDMAPFLGMDNVLGLAEMMNYPGVLANDPDTMDKIALARKRHKLINGHAPLLSGHELDRYIKCGIRDDHECSSFAEAAERIRKGQRVMIRQGTSAQNLKGLIDLFDEPYARRCMLATDDKHPFDLLENGHIDSIIRQAVAMGRSAVTGIQMATIQAAEFYGLEDAGAIAPGYKANLLVLSDLDTVDVCDVFHNGIRVCRGGAVIGFDKEDIDPIIAKSVYRSFYIKRLTPEGMMIEPQTDTCRVIQVIPGELLTNEVIRKMDFTRDNGVDTSRGIIKVAVCERHMMTGHIGLGYIEGLGIDMGAIASSVSHDSHNLIIAGTNARDMAAAGNAVTDMGGGLAVVKDGEVLAALPLPIAGLMSTQDAKTVSDANFAVREAAARLGHSAGIEPFMNLAFISLPVIPTLKMTTQGLVNVTRFERVPLFV